jgi:hypothetical protein
MEIINLHGKETPTAPNIVLIDRRSKWGNPYKMDSEKDRLKVIWNYVFYVLDKPELLNDIHSLEYKTLACWCVPAPCHGEVLKYLAEHPWIIIRYQRGSITKEEIAESIFMLNGWNVPGTTKQITLF